MCSFTIMVKGWSILYDFFVCIPFSRVLNVKALVDTFKQKQALVDAFS